jgi:hypothetical protein
LGSFISVTDLRLPPAQRCAPVRLSPRRLAKIFSIGWVHNDRRDLRKHP